MKCKSLNIHMFPNRRLTHYKNEELVDFAKTFCVCFCCWILNFGPYDVKVVFAQGLERALTIKTANCTNETLEQVLTCPHGLQTEIYLRLA